MGKTTIVDVPLKAWEPQPVATLRLGPGRWEVIHSDPEEGKDSVILMARRVEPPRA